MDGGARALRVRLGRILRPCVDRRGFQRPPQRDGIDTEQRSGSCAGLYIHFLRARHSGKAVLSHSKTGDAARARAFAPLRPPVSG